jgi:hypothetical protein
MRCRDCAETILAAAGVCKHCRHRLQVHLHLRRGSPARRALRRPSFAVFEYIEAFYNCDRPLDPRDALACRAREGPLRCERARKQIDRDHQIKVSSEAGEVQ